MRILLDTHIFLWFISRDARLPADLRDTIRDPKNEVYLSAVSVWEAMVKYQLGKLPLPENPGTYLPKQRELHQIASLALDEKSVVQLVVCQGNYDRWNRDEKLRKTLVVPCPPSTPST
ncbi:MULTISPECIES: type II toxin-antitoxin system VapC family toxin [unclassified Phormidium]|uniref:type II toxin-antitoxin system VapC family toxin n=1 Tax=unclassified Phormidium TaxID=2609805 RepID=UPI0037C513F4